MNINKKLLDWYDLNRRILPWRKKSKIDFVDPYIVWISEIMLQQTNVKKVIPYFNRFIKKYPNIYLLANSSIEEVLELWAGLGYYARARNLHKCAKIISNEYGGIFPNNTNDLMKLPGIGEYTSSAIVSIAFNKVAFAIDVNIHRVIIRLLNKHQASKTEISNFIERIIHKDRPGDFTEALMDLGAKICKVRSPKCVICPLSKNCKTFKKDINGLLLNSFSKKEKPKKYGICLIIKRHSDGSIFFVRRPNEGLYGGMLSLPTSNLVDDKKKLRNENFINKREYKKFNDEIFHTFSHFKLALTIYYKEVENFNIVKGNWVNINLARPHLPSLMKKVVDRFIF